jgi:quercetin dioxygenase-like cupin family protein
MHVPLSTTRVVETPAATMRTYASPSTSAAAPVAVWRTEMAAATSGPVHVVDVDQVVVVVAGHLAVDLAGRQFVVPAGDSAVLPAGAERRLSAGAEELVTVTASLPGASARMGDRAPVPVPWTR